MYTHLLNVLEAVPEIPQNGILSRTFFKDEHIKVLVFGFDAGQELSEHTSSHPAILHFLQGEADLTLGEDHQPAQPGTWVYMPPNLPHSIYAKTPLIMLLVMIQQGE
jgi:quercetin dioxygenase-like cupin family protein